MTGIFESFGASGLGKEINILVCSLPRKKPVDLFYTYFANKSQSHRLEFRVGNRTKFEMFLQHYQKDIAQFCYLIENNQYRRSTGNIVFGFWTRLALLLSAGKIISSRDILAGPSSEMQTESIRARLAYRYRLAYCRKGTEESIMLISSKQSSQSGAYRKGQSTEFNWLKCSLKEAKELAKNLRSFIDSSEFREILTN